MSFSYSDWLAANQGNGTPSQPTDYSPSVADAYKAGKAGTYASYGDFLAAQTPNYDASDPYKGMGVWDFALSQSKPQGYDMQGHAAQDMFAAGQRNANTAGAKAAMDTFNAGNFNAGQGHLTPEQAKQAQKDSLAAGAAYRRDQLRQQYSKDPMHKFERFGEQVEDVFDPLGLRKKFFDPLSIPHYVQGGMQGFDPMGVTGPASGGNWDPSGYLGQDYTNNDQGFSRWLQEHGYNANYEQG